MKGKKGNDRTVETNMCGLMEGDIIINNCKKTIPRKSVSGKTTVYPKSFSGKVRSWNTWNPGS